MILVETSNSTQSTEAKKPCYTISSRLYLWNCHYRILQPLDLACGTLFRSSCAIQTSPIRTVQTTAEGTPFSKSMNTAICDLVCGALEKHLLIYLLTYLLTHNKMSKLSQKKTTINNTMFLLIELRSKRIYTKSKITKILQYGVIIVLSPLKSV